MKEEKGNIKPNEQQQKQRKKKANKQKIKVEDDDLDFLNEVLANRSEQEKIAIERVAELLSQLEKLIPQDKK